MNAVPSLHRSRFFAGFRGRTDDVEAIKRLRQGIQSLNREARERLLTSFETVNNHFKRLFTELFGGGCGACGRGGSRGGCGACGCGGACGRARGGRAGCTGRGYGVGGGSGEWRRGERVGWGCGDGSGSSFGRLVVISEG